MATIAIIGRSGFLGGALARRFTDVSSFPTKDTKYLFHFGSPTHMGFNQNSDYHTKEVFDSFLYLLPYCRDNEIKFIYASSALVYEPDTAFSRHKKALELLAANYSNTLGLRIFPVYDKDHTVIAEWCKDKKAGRVSTIYGNGSQIRDFIHINDAVEQIISLMDNTGIWDIGAGKPYAFSKIIEMIGGKFVYVDKPEGYFQGIYCKNPLPTKISLDEGIRNILLSSD